MLKGLFSGGFGVMICVQLSGAENDICTGTVVTGECRVVPRDSFNVFKSVY